MNLYYWLINQIIPSDINFFMLRILLQFECTNVQQQSWVLYSMAGSDYWMNSLQLILIYLNTIREMHVCRKASYFLLHVSFYKLIVLFQWKFILRVFSKLYVFHDSWYMNNVTHNFFMYLFIFLTLYVSSTSCSSSGEKNYVNTNSGSCHSVSVTVSCAGRKWTSDLHTTQPPTQSDSYQRLYWHNFSLLMMSTMCSKHIELKI